MTYATVNDNAQGVTKTYIGHRVELVSSGQNRLHLIVRFPGERRTFGLPTNWLDIEQDTKPGEQVGMGI